LKSKFFLVCLFAIIVSMFISCNFSSMNSKFVNPKILNQYNASVSIGDITGNIFGSGTVIKKDDKIFVITAAHVIEGFKKRKIAPHIITRYFTKPIKAKIVKMNSARDLALLKMSIRDSKIKWFAKISTSHPRIGDHVWLIGSPHDQPNTVTDGVVSRRMIFARKGYKERITIMGSTAHGFFGSSGGGVFNDKGELIGVFNVIAHIFGYGHLPGGNYFIPLQYLQDFLK